MPFEGGQRERRSVSQYSVGEQGIQTGIMDEQLFLEQIEPRGEAVSTALKLLWNSVILTKCVAVDTPQKKNTPTCTHPYLLKTLEKSTNRPF